MPLTQIPPRFLCPHMPLYNPFPPRQLHFKWHKYNKYTALIKSQSLATHATKYNSVFLHAAFCCACMPWRSRLGRERERALCLFICGCFLACQDKEGNMKPVWEHNFTLSALAWSAGTHVHISMQVCTVYTGRHTHTFKQEERLLTYWIMLFGWWSSAAQCVYARVCVREWLAA